MDHEPGSGETAPRHLLEHHHVEQIVEPETAVLLGNRAAEHSGFARLQPEIARNDLILLPLVMVGTNFTMDEGAHHVAKLLVFRLEEASFEHRFCRSDR